MEDSYVVVMKMGDDSLQLSSFSLEDDTKDDICILRKDTKENCDEYSLCCSTIYTTYHIDDVDITNIPLVVIKDDPNLSD